MTRVFHAALAFACVCTPALAAPMAIDPIGAAKDAAIVFVGGVLAIGLLYLLVRLLSRSIIDLFSRFSMGALALVCLSVPAMAAMVVAPAVTASPGVTLPYGSWIVQYGPDIAILLATWLTGLVSWALAKWAPWATSVATQARLQMAAEALAQYAIKAIPNSVKDGKVTVNAGPAVIATAVQRGVNVLPDRVIKAMIKGGGMSSIIFRVLDLEEDASEHTVLTPAITKLKASMNPKLAKAA